MALGQQKRLRPKGAAAFLSSSFGHNKAFRLQFDDRRE
ncbi:hypothetical protein SGRA_1728 [Saprospira grandis str. Lewin]|uniref:Uncharacterized protein n=1 Tax=Saprospira grandis (strain Lewin) TaxID=984262 RepID=H6KZ73_SAPGL|nr:hypothetical protein SGRA_1728 [Saprospira grandis str. Lewin]